jgi:ribosome recycling factor
MADFKALKSDSKRRMDGAVDALHKEFGGLRTGRASVNLLEPIMVEAYGAEMPLNQVGTVGVPEPRMLSVQVWDKSQVSAVEKAIRNAGLGLNPAVDGQTVRVPVPPLTEERRAELAKVAGKYAEEARIAVRNVRRHAMDELKRMEKDGEIGQDDHHHQSDEIQKLTDEYVGKIDEALHAKEQEIMQV